MTQVSEKYELLPLRPELSTVPATNHSLSSVISNYTESRDPHHNTDSHSVVEKKRNVEEEDIGGPRARKRKRWARGSEGSVMGSIATWLRFTFARLFLPDGYPHSVAPGYLPYLLLIQFAVARHSTRQLPYM
jgi:hypothetical protein